MAAQAPEAYATLLVSDGYLPGAMVLAHSLRDAGTTKLLIALVTLDSVSGASVSQLATVYDQILPVDRITNRNPANLYLMNRPDLTSTFTKIALWRQTQFARLVYLDADALALRAPDELFSRSSAFAAAPDVGWPDCFNSGVMALTPNMGDYYALLALAQRGISFDGADQGLLNMHFGGWDRLSFGYNCTPSAGYQYVPAYRHFQSSVSVVHYIGREKPWVVGREGKGGAGVYEELLGRWWAVYDKHFRVPNAPAAVKGQPSADIRIIRQYVAGEAFRDDGFSSAPSMAQSQKPMQIPTVEQRRFSAPQAEWDPISHPPPTQSKPEAANFPSHTYTMSEDKSFFQAPKSYPEPPKGMGYQVPRTPPTSEKPKPLFPWEENQAPPTRVFPDEPPSPEPIADLHSEPPTEEDDHPAPSISTTGLSSADPNSPATPTIHVTPEPFHAYSRSNAWDEMPAINRYVEAMAASRRGKPAGASSPGADPSSDAAIFSPTSETPRRPSMKLTDFPTEFERPSLPVTPAPVRRPSFWGEERDEAGELPPAQGVPRQQDWDPLKKLDELQRRQSEVLAEGPKEPGRELPSRELPASAVLRPTSEEVEVPMSSVSRVSDKGMEFSSVSFGGEKSGEDEGVFSPTET